MARVHAGDAWIRDDPAVRDRIVFSWHSSSMDRCLEEDEQILSHPRDPHKRVDALPGSHHVTVVLDVVVLADSRQTVLSVATPRPRVPGPSPARSSLTDAPSAFRSESLGGGWHRSPRYAIHIRGMRNRIAHGYPLVESDISGKGAEMTTHVATRRSSSAAVKWRRRFAEVSALQRPRDSRCSRSTVSRDANHASSPPGSGRTCPNSSMFS